MRFKIVGPHRIAGKPSGATVDLSALTEKQLAALVEGGHVEKVSKSEKVDSDQEKENTK